MGALLLASRRARYTFCGLTPSGTSAPSTRHLNATRPGNEWMAQASADGGRRRQRPRTNFPRTHSARFEVRFWWLLLAKYLDLRCLRLVAVLGEYFRFHEGIQLRQDLDIDHTASIRRLNIQKPSCWTHRPFIQLFPPVPKCTSCCTTRPLGPAQVGLPETRRRKSRNNRCSCRLLQRPRPITPTLA